MPWTLEHVDAAPIITIGILMASAQGSAHAAGPGLKESEVWELSDRYYEMILAGARQKGWSFPIEQIRHGYIRSHEEFRLQLIDRGYAIISDDASL